MTTTPILSAATIASLRTIAARGHTMSIVLRRGGGSLPAQAGIIVAEATARWQAGDGGRTAQARPRLIGAHDMDVQQGDRLTDAQGAVYEVVYLHPDRQVETISDLEVRQ